MGSSNVMTILPSIGKSSVSTSDNTVSLYVTLVITGPLVSGLEGTVKSNSATLV